MPKPWVSPEDAYLNDPGFRAVVDQLEHLVHAAQLTPAEVRAAAVLACIHYESKIIRSFKVDVGMSGKMEIAAIESRVADLKRWIDFDGNHPYRSNPKGGA